MHTQRMGRFAALAVWLVCAVASADGAPPPLCARYALRRPSGQLEHLELVRSGHAVAHRFVERGQQELWERDARGELEHVRAFPSEGKSVHYTPGDLRTINLWPAWDTLAQLIGQAELDALTAAGRKPGFQRMNARVLKGTLRGQPARVEWLEALSLPSKLVLGKGAQQLTMELVALNADAPSGTEAGARCGRSTQQGEKRHARCDACGPARKLRSLEFADLGDMEYDPFVRRFLAREEHHRHPLH